ncbi:MAG: hypothetical protein L0H93_11120 [Nocardioides sp.]|nr:hypothetical protein [Nocardioides sp.]
MAAARARLRDSYGAGSLHLLVVLASLALAAYAVSVLGFGELWDPDVWWQSILLWFLGAVLLHDFVLFPVYALADRLLGGALRRGRGSKLPANVSLVNHLRVPALAIGLLLLLFLPGIIEQGASSYNHATGQTQEPFLERWLILSAAICALSAGAYGIRVVRTRNRPLGPAHRAGPRQDESEDTTDPRFR